MFDGLRSRAKYLYGRFSFVRDAADFVVFYSTKVVPRAFKDSLSFVGRHMWKELLLAVLLVVAALATGEAVTRTEDLEASLVLLLIVAGSLAALLFVIEFFMAPIKIEREHEAEIKSLHAHFFQVLTKRKVLFSTKQDMSRAGLPIASELREIRKMADMMLEANSGDVATPYRAGFQFPRANWDTYGDKLTPDKELYAVVDAAYAEAHRANEIIAWRETQKSTRLFGMGKDDDLESVRDAADKAIAALDLLPVPVDSSGRQLL